MANATDEEPQDTDTDLGTRVVVYAHIHVPYVQRLPEMSVANAGSVSQSYDGDRRAAYVPSVRLVPNTRVALPTQ